MFCIQRCSLTHQSRAQEAFQSLNMIPYQKMIRILESPPLLFHFESQVSKKVGLKMPEVLLEYIQWFWTNIFRYCTNKRKGLELQWQSMHSYQHLWTKRVYWWIFDTSLPSVLLIWLVLITELIFSILKRDCTSLVPKKKDLSSMFIVYAQKIDLPSLERAIIYWNSSLLKVKEQRCNCIPKLYPQSVSYEYSQKLILVSPKECYLFQESQKYASIVSQ